MKRADLKVGDLVYVARSRTEAPEWWKPAIVFDTRPAKQLEGHYSGYVPRIIFPERSNGVVVVQETNQHWSDEKFWAPKVKQLAVVHTPAQRDAEIANRIARAKASAEQAKRSEALREVQRQSVARIFALLSSELPDVQFRDDWQGGVKVNQVALDAIEDVLLTSLHGPEAAERQKGQREHGRREVSV